MIRVILFVVVVLFLMVGGLAVLLFQWFGWRGLIAFPFILIGVVWIAKIVISKLIKKFALGLFSMKSGVLREATLTVHSVSPVSKPLEPADEDGDNGEDAMDVEEVKVVEMASEKAASSGESSQALATRKSAEAEAGEEDEEDDECEAAHEKPKEYFAVDMTITPKDGNSDRVWEPGELILTSEPIKSLEYLEDGDKDIGSADQVEVWDGSRFGPDDGCKYPGTQRLKVTFAVNQGTRKAWMHYYEVTLGPLDLPPWKL